ncbi:hypothetical protein SAMN04515617_13013 [Collimonas sp. OK242]|jgi:hypothetical protein|uniref:hypothetical protein n=1 Tax=Collimonas sp. OK242 TaxID=1798195 RepID=UPI0008962B57|nr:hypothetical protein [Collimonas sp. OK242]SDY91931.1 hypothetical protein SAMN04515617_13013 [Collimonas sp. OK242]
MFKKIICTSLFLAVLSSLSGCAINRATASVTPGVDLKAMRTFYVVKSPKDENNVDQLIKDYLVKKGYSVTTGPELIPPYQADGVVTYIDKWFWDITMYMIELTINVRQPSNNFPVAVGNSYHTSLTRESPPQMVNEVMTNIYKDAK